MYVVACYGPYLMCGGTLAGMLEFFMIVEANPELLAIADASALLQISQRHFWTLVKKEKLPKPVKLGRATRWRIADLREAVSALEPTH